MTYPAKVQHTSNLLDLNVQKTNENPNCNYNHKWNSAYRRELIIYIRSIQYIELKALLQRRGIQERDWH